MIENAENATNFRHLTSKQDEEKLLALKATLVVYATALTVLIQLGGIGYFIAKVWSR